MRQACDEESPWVIACHEDSTGLAQARPKSSLQVDAYSLELPNLINTSKAAQFFCCDQEAMSHCCSWLGGPLPTSAMLSIRFGRWRDMPQTGTFRSTNKILRSAHSCRARQNKKQAQCESTTPRRDQFISSPYGMIMQLA